MKKSISIGCIFVVVLLLFMSFPSVVGYQTVKSTVDDRIQNIKDRFEKNDFFCKYIRNRIDGQHITEGFIFLLVGPLKRIIEAIIFIIMNFEWVIEGIIQLPIALFKIWTVYGIIPTLVRYIGVFFVFLLLFFTVGVPIG